MEIEKSNRDLVKIIVAGGTGFIGKTLIQTLLDQGHSVILLSRSSGPLSFSSSNFQKEIWDAKSVGAWKTHLESADALINLTGEGIANKRWTPIQKRILYDSRIKSTQALVQAISQTFSKPKTLINASAIGFYGSVTEGNLTEKSNKGNGFLPDLCHQWEEEALKAETFGVKVAVLRIGIVLEKEGGALAKMLLPFKLGLGGPLGNGKQWMSWIHRDDMVQLILHILRHNSLSGAINATAPNPVMMKEFASTLAHELHRPAFLPAPAFAIKIMLGEMSTLLLEGQKVVPEKLLESGFQFQYSKLDKALHAILKK